MIEFNSSVFVIKQYKSSSIFAQVHTELVNYRITPTEEGMVRSFGCEGVRFRNWGNPASSTGMYFLTTRSPPSAVFTLIIFARSFQPSAVVTIPVAWSTRTSKTHCKRSMKFPHTLWRAQMFSLFSIQF